MKFFAFMSLALSLSAFAAKPDFTCVSPTTSVKYEVYFSKFTEIHMTQPNGETEYQDSISSDVKFFETFPLKTVYTFTHEEGDVVATVTKQGSKTTFKGFGDIASCK